MAFFRLQRTAATLAAAGLALSGAVWAQGSPPDVAPPTSAVTSPNTPPATGSSGSQSGGTEDFINLFLRKVGIFTLGFFHAFNECVKFSDVSNGHNDLLIMLNSFSKSVAQRINTTV